jgi:DNA primase
VIRRRTTGEAAKREHVFSKEMPIMVKVKNNNFCDSLGKMSLRYAVLSKENRIQILVNPTPRQLRKRGKRQWQLVQAIDGEADARQMLQSALQAALQDLDRGEHANGDA